MKNKNGMVYLICLLVIIVCLFISTNGLYPLITAIAGLILGVVATSDWMSKELDKIKLQVEEFVKDFRELSNSVSTSKQTATDLINKVENILKKNGYGT